MFTNLYSIFAGDSP